MTQHDDKYVNAVSNGANTSEEIAEALDLSPTTVRTQIPERVEAGLLTRERDGRSYVYSVADPSEAEAAEAARSEREAMVNEARDFKRPDRDPTTFGVFGGDQNLAPDRDYDFDNWVVEEPVEYIPTGDEWEEIQADIDGVDLIGKPARARLGGPSGAGKTTLAERTSFERGWPMFTIQGSYSMTGKDIIGGPKVLDSETIWLDGTLVKALLSSAERPTLLLLDEVNRARPQAKGDLFSALDHRAEVHIPFTGETIRGNPENLVVISTMNEGAGFITEQLDDAESRRLGPKYNVDYLGREHPDKEADLVASRAPVHEDLAREMVDVANNIRGMADDNDSAVHRGVPTSEVITWAQGAATRSERGIDKPVMAAAEAYIVRALFHKDGEETKASQEVRTVIESSLGDAPADPEAYIEWADLDPLNDIPDADADDADGDLGDLFGEDSAVACMSCGWEDDRSAAEEDGVLATWTCPDCGDDVVRAE